MSERINHGGSHAENQSRILIGSKISCNCSCSISSSFSLCSQKVLSKASERFSLNEAFGLNKEFQETLLYLGIYSGIEK